MYTFQIALFQIFYISRFLPFEFLPLLLLFKFMIIAQKIFLLLLQDSNRLSFLAGLSFSVLEAIEFDFKAIIIQS